jgi:hypothetical protein
VLCVADAESALAEERRLRSMLYILHLHPSLSRSCRLSCGETHKRVVVALRKPMPQQRRRRAISGAN